MTILLILLYLLVPTLTLIYKGYKQVNDPDFFIFHFIFFSAYSEDDDQALSHLMLLFWPLFFFVEFYYRISRALLNKGSGLQAFGAYLAKRKKKCENGNKENTLAKARVFFIYFFNE